MKRIACAAVAAVLCKGVWAEVSFENEYVRVAFDGAGCVSSIRETATGRELVGAKVPFVSFTRADGTVVAPVRCDGVGKSGLRFAFPDGSCRLSVAPFPGGWTFRTEAVELRDAAALTLGRIAPSCNREKGAMSNVVMDDRSAVVLRGYVPEIDMDAHRHQPERTPDDRETWVAVRREHGFTGLRYGLSAGPADRILMMLSGMAEAAGMTQTGCGGPKSLSTDANRGAYLFGTWMDKSGEEDWIRLLDKAGCQMFHLHAWWLTRGDYAVNPACFPGGLADLKAFVDRLHADGKRVSTHSLSAVVQFGDSHVAPEWFDDFVTDADYTLARSYRRGDRELWINEKPIAGHAKILTGGTAGNILRLGDDLLQYDDFTTEPPYRFLGVHVAREPYGDVGTFDATQALGVEAAKASAGTGKVRALSRASYPDGHAVSYLHHAYSEFVPKPGSRLAEELTDRLAAVYNDLELDGIYFDGSEAMPDRYGTDWLRERTIAKLRPRNGMIVNSASCRNPFNWWNRSLVGTWDHPTYAPRAFNDEHIRIYRDVFRADFLRTDLGWWGTHAGNDLSRGYFPEEQEYVMCKTAAHDMTISLQGAMPSDGPLAFAVDSQLTIFGKWERARYARAFRPELLEKMREGGRGFVLGQDGTGCWNLSELFYRPHRVACPQFADWTFDLPVAGDGALRVEALYGVDREAARTNTVRVLDASMLAELAQEAAKGVRLEVAMASDPERGETIRLMAANDGAEPKGAWARVSREFGIRNLFRVNPVSSLWVKGDGSGATLNVQVRGARAYGGGVSENLVVLDFTGWRKVDLLLREKDAEESSRFDWPYEMKVNAFMVPLSGEHIDRVSFYLNGIPSGKTATVELGAWDSLPMRRGVLAKGAQVTVNGRTLTVPFEMKGAEFAELRDGVWTHFAQKGEELARVRTGEAFKLVRGRNIARYAGVGDGGFARAEVTFFASGAPEAAFGPLTAEQRRLMKVEYEMPAMLDPAKGLAGPFPVRVRPGERASVGFEILGPVTNPTVAGRRIPVTLANERERVASYDGKTWRAIRIVPGECGPDNRTKPSRRLVLAEGTFAEPLPVLTGGRTDLAVTADAASGARVTFVKTYLP